MDHGHDMGGMGSPSSAMNNNNTTTGAAGGMKTMHPHRKMMMHMTFFWGKNAEILFFAWPGTRTGMYVLALIFVFFLSVLVEWLSHSRFIKPGSANFAAGLIQSLLHALRVSLAYMVMLAVMSFNGGVFLVAVAGHTLGFLIVGSRAFKKTATPDAKTFDLPPTSC